MSELDQLRSDLAVLEKYRDRYGNFGCAVDETKAAIREIESEQADPWREAKLFITETTSECDTALLRGYVDHLTAENERLSKRVAELEKEPEFTPAVLKRADEVLVGDVVLAGGMIRTVTDIDSTNGIQRVIKCGGWMAWFYNGDLVAVLPKPLAEAKTIAEMQPPFEGPVVGLEPILEPARVLATAVNVLGSIYKKKLANDVFYVLKSLDVEVKPYRVKGGERGEG